MLTDSMVRNSPFAERFVYLPMMNACRRSDECGDGVVSVVLCSDWAVGMAVAKNNTHTNSPIILFFMVLFPRLLSDGFIFKCLEKIKITANGMRTCFSSLITYP